MNSLFVSTGEISGDLLLEGLLTGLRRQGFDGEVFGMAGFLVDSLMTERQPNEGLKIMGFQGVLGALPRLFALKNRLVETVLARRPDGVCLVDSPDFHLPLLRHLRRAGYQGPVFFVSPPTVWAWRQGRAKTLARYATLSFPLFSFEHALLTSLGVASCYEGHPLVDADPSSWNQGQPTPRGQVALLPGSRKREIQALLPLFLELAPRLRALGLSPVLSLAPSMSAEVASMVRRCAGEIPVDERGGRFLMATSELVIGASGTAAVEAMALSRPMAVLYRGTALEWLLFKTFVRTPFVSIPNLLAGYEVYPEFLQGHCAPEPLACWVERFMSDDRLREETAACLKNCAASLGRPGVAHRWAARILEHLG